MLFLDLYELKNLAKVFGFFFKKCPDKIFILKKAFLKICADNNYALINWINFLDGQSTTGTL